MDRTQRAIDLVRAAYGDCEVIHSYVYEKNGFICFMALFDDCFLSFAVNPDLGIINTF